MGVAIGASGSHGPKRYFKTLMH
uniref:Uncharacterized protein n=1 Tax=Anguilla anguilla TaxID=7936 RepID=A0A0E9VM85_ANGAN